MRRKGLELNVMRRLLMTAAAIVVGTSGVAAAADMTPKANKAEPSIWERDTLTGDWGGARTALKNQGIDITLNYIGEAFGVLSGGIDQGANYEGRFEFSVDTDLQKLIGWTGGTTHFTIYQINNSGGT